MPSARLRAMPVIIAAFRCAASAIAPIICQDAQATLRHFSRTILLDALRRRTHRGRWTCRHEAGAISPPIYTIFISANIFTPTPRQRQHFTRCADAASFPQLEIGRPRRSPCRPIDAVIARHSAGAYARRIMHARIPLLGARDFRAATIRADKKSRGDYILPAPAISRRLEHAAAGDDASKS